MFHIFPNIIVKHPALTQSTHNERIAAAKLSHEDFEELLT